MNLRCLPLFFVLVDCIAAAPAPARLEVEPKGRILLGSVGPREVQTLAYTFTNRSTAPITLRLAELSPGVKAWGPALTGPFGPGQSLGLTMTVDPEDFVGPQVRAIRLITVDPGQGEYRLPVAMDVRPDLTVDSLRKSLGDIAPNQTPQAVFTFTRATGQPLVLRPVSAPPYLEAELLHDGAAARLQLTFRQALVPPGATRGLETFEIETNAPLQPRFTLFLEWRLRHPVEALPSRIVFLDPAITEQELLLRARDGQPFLLAEARVEGSGFTVGPLPASAPKQRLIIQRTGKPAARAVLVLRCQGQDQPRTGQRARACSGIRNTRRSLTMGVPIATCRRSMGSLP